MADQVDALLHYLHSHTYEQAKKVFPPEVLAEVQDVGGYLNLILESPHIFKELIITTNGIPGVFKGNPSFSPLPGTVIHSINNAPGTFFIRGAPPSGENQFWLTQYPPYPGEPVGRTILEFYTDYRITAVFKTNNDNFGGAGTGNFS